MFGISPRALSPKGARRSFTLGSLSSAPSANDANPTRSTGCTTICGRPIAHLGSGRCGLRLADARLRRYGCILFSLNGFVGRAVAGLVFELRTYLRTVQRTGGGGPFRERH